MSSGAIIPMILEKANAVEDFRKLIGATDPAKAAPGTIRNLFAKSIEANAIHGSDSDENAAIEANFFFSSLERFWEAIELYQETRKLSVFFFACDLSSGSSL